MTRNRPQITVCIPHWQVEPYIKLCLRSIRRYSAGLDLEVIVVDNGSRDGSLDYLKALDWIRLIERPAEHPGNWPLNVFTAWDDGLAQARGEYFVTMHSDVFVMREGWLDPFLREIQRGPQIAAAGAWKLELENAIYGLQKRVVGYGTALVKSWLGQKQAVPWRQERYPRDYCAMYRSESLRHHGLTFRPVDGSTGGGYSIARQIWDAGFETAMFPVREMAENVYHVAHGTAAVRPEKPLGHRRAQRKVVNKVRALFREQWIQDLDADTSLDAAFQPA